MTDSTVNPTNTKWPAFCQGWQTESKTKSEWKGIEVQVGEGLPVTFSKALMKAEKAVADAIHKHVLDWISQRWIKPPAPQPTSSINATGLSWKDFSGKTTNKANWPQVRKGEADKLTPRAGLFLCRPTLTEFHTVAEGLRPEMNGYLATTGPFHTARWIRVHVNHAVDNSLHVIGWTLLLSSLRPYTGVLTALLFLGTLAATAMPALRYRVSREANSQDADTTGFNALCNRISSTTWEKIPVATRDQWAGYIGFVQNIPVCVRKIMNESWAASFVYAHLAYSWAPWLLKNKYTQLHFALTAALSVGITVCIADYFGRELEPKKVKAGTL